MHIILLSGGSGKRLWPLSNEIRSKQFLQRCRVPGGKGYESMVQRVYRQIKQADPDATVTLATSKSQVSSIHNQLGEAVGISVEPCRRDTFPAIALACAWLHDERGVGADEPVVVCPVDPFVDDSYFTAVRRLGELAAQGSAKLSLMGIDPAGPSDRYGYIIPTSRDEVSRVQSFKEKPDTETARAYLAQGALWNGGVFAFRLGYLLDRTHELTGCIDYADLYARYEMLPAISFDYAVVEKESDIALLRYHGAWRDLGTWHSLTEAMEEPTVGNVRLASDCSGVNAINELGIPILAVGLHDVVISAGPDGILVADKERSSGIKSLVDTIDQQVMYAEKSWGSIRVLDVEHGSMTIKVSVKPGHRMNYHSHERRDEVWTVISGRGRTVVDGMEQPVSTGDVVTMAAGCKHTVIADTALQLIEVQLGEDISVFDKHKYELEL
ncbi:MAG: cupin domain-containing protein [Bacteroidales bacterium]|nr:cupin domain-containing protein [Bacteroidales bacterium]